MIRVYIPTIHATGTLLGHSQNTLRGDRAPRTVVKLDDGRTVLCDDGDWMDATAVVVFPAKWPESVSIPHLGVIK